MPRDAGDAPGGPDTAGDIGGDTSPSSAAGGEGAPGGADYGRSPGALGGHTGFGNSPGALGGAALEDVPQAPEGGFWSGLNSWLDDAFTPDMEQGHLGAVGFLPFSSMLMLGPVWDDIAKNMDLPIQTERPPPGHSWSYVHGKGYGDEGGHVAVPDSRGDGGPAEPRPAGAAPEEEEETPAPPSEFGYRQVYDLLRGEGETQFTEEQIRRFMRPPPMPGTGLTAPRPYGRG